MKKDPLVYLLHIRDAIHSIELYTRRGKKYFLEHNLTQDAVIYNLAIIGEAVKKIPKALRDTQPDIPWRDITALRNIVIHEYDGTDIKKIWRIVEKDVPLLKHSIYLMLEKSGDIKAIEGRKNEPTVPLSKIFSRRSKRKNHT